MSRMNKKTRDKFYKLLVNRDGEICQRCGALPILRKLVIDHRNNENSDNRLGNLQLLCRSCNYLKGREPVALCVSDNSNSCLEVNKKKEPLFRKFVYNEFARYGNNVSITLNHLINAGAEAVGISTVTAKRYLDKMTSHRGRLQLDCEDESIKRVKMRKS